jgi:hypothetical protein
MHFIPTEAQPTEFGQSSEERQQTVTCMREHRGSWYVVQYKCNHSAFNGYHETRSEYSGVRCNACGRYWRTRAAYVETLPDAPPPGDSRT